MKDQVTPLAALSAQMASGTPISIGFKLLREVMQQTFANRCPEGGISLGSLTLKATNYDELYEELAALQGDAQAIAQVLEIFRHAVRAHISGRESA